MAETLEGTTALVAGATRGAGRGTAVALGEAGATVYCSGRTTREQRSDYDRPETIEETAEQVSAAGGTGIAVQADHLQPEQVDDLVARIDAEQGRLDAISESPRFVGRAVAALAGDPQRARRNGQLLSSGALAKRYGFIDVDGSQPDCWRYLVEVQEAGRPADTTGYR